MHFALSILGKNLLPVLSIILSLSYSDRSVNASETNEFNLCTQRHCEDCVDGEFFKCSNRALSNRCGDLCGCCHSCVQFRDFGESCGSQLAVRSSENFQDSRSRVTIIATTRCKDGLICKSFACKRLEKVFFENNDDESSELKTNFITIDNPIEFQQHINKVENDKTLFKRRIKLPTFTEIPSIREISLANQSQKRKIFSDNSHQDVKKMENILFNPSRHLINLLMAGKEFQLIYGHEPLKDLNLLIDSIDKNDASSIINEFQAKILCERFKEVLQFVNSKRKEPNDEKLINSSSTSPKIENDLKNENEKNPPVVDSGMIAVLRNFVLIPRTQKISKLRVPVRKLRKKRELGEVEKSKDEAKVEISKNERQIDEKNRKEYSGASIYDVVNETTRQIEDFDHWIIARKIEIKPDEKSRVGKIVNGDGIESEINIHISGVPRMSNFRPKDIAEKNLNLAKLDEKVAEEYENYENSEIFVGDANTSSSEFSTLNDSQKLANITSEISQSQKNLKSDKVDNYTENDWKNYEKSPFYNYEFPFPENPITLESNSVHDFDNFVNETVDEFKSQLDRIETKTMDIENVLFDMIEKMEEKSKNIENRETETKIIGIEPEKKNQFEKKFVTTDRSKIYHISSEYSTSPRPSTVNPENKIAISDGSKLGKFSPNRSNRHWRTFTIQPNLPETQKIVNSQRRRPSQSGEDKSDEPEVTSGQDKLTKGSENSDQQNQESQPRSSSTIKISKDIPKALGQRKFPILLSTSDVSGTNFDNYQQDDPQLFSRKRSNLEVTSDSQQHRSAWPLNLILNRALSANRGSRKSPELIKHHQRNLESENPLEESIILLETQIPKSILRPRDSMIYGDRMGVSSTRLLTNYGDDDDWNWDDERPSLNLFVVDGENLEYGMSSRSNLPKSLVLPMQNIHMETSNPESQEIDENYHISPAYLDYSERLEKNEKDDEIVESEKTESTTNPVKIKRSNTRNIGRKKRSLIDFFESQNFKETNKILRPKKMINSNVNGSFSNSTSTNIKKSIYSSENTENDQKDRKKLENLQSEIYDSKNASKKRSRRSVQMVDWLRAAQEYHERLRQVKIAAMKTWLASKEELDDTNLTNVKLFSREVPAYLERYRPDLENVYLNSQVEDSQEIRYPGDSMPDISEVLTDILAEQTLPEKNDIEPEMDATNGGQLSISEISNVNGPKKFTIITNGNSTLRIEEMLDDDEDDEVTWFEDQSAQDSTGSETHKIPITISAGDYFDHMYESVDADDEEFDEDPNLTMSRPFDLIEVIEPSSVESSETKNPESEKLKENNFESEEDKDPSSRFKRDSPFFLFKVKGNPRHDVIVWPSNWKDLINRHSRLNRTRDSSQKTTPRKTHLRITKIDPILGSSTIMRSNIDENHANQDDQIPSSSEIIVKKEKSAHDSSVDLDIARKLPNNFEHRTKQSRRRNGVYRGNIGNYG